MNYQLQPSIDQNSQVWKTATEETQNVLQNISFLNNYQIHDFLNINPSTISLNCKKLK